MRFLASSVSDGAYDFADQHEPVIQRTTLARNIRIFMMRFTKPLSCPPEGESAFTCERAARTKGRGNAGEQQLCTSHPSPHTESTVACERSARMRAEMAGVHGWDKACKSAMMRPASGGAENAQRERVGVTELHLSSTLVLSALL